MRPIKSTSQRHQSTWAIHSFRNKSIPVQFFHPRTISGEYCFGLLQLRNPPFFPFKGEIPLVTIFFQLKDNIRNGNTPLSHQALPAVFPVVILDMDMPQIRAYQLVKNIPIIMIGAIAVFNIPKDPEIFCPLPDWMRKIIIQRLLIWQNWRRLP